MRFVTATLTDRHGRQTNEDCFRVLETPRCHCWVVADGLGGHEGGEVASRLAAEEIINSCAARPEFTPVALRRHLEAAQQALLARQKADPRCSDMRTTVVVLMATGDRALWAHLGDSRLYYFRGGKIAARTRDHSVTQALVNAGEIPEEDLRTHEDRHRLLRALGDKGNFRPSITDQPHPLEPGDAFLLCTDGFWQYVLEEEMEVALVHSRTPEEWLEKLAARLRQRAWPGSSEADNFTALGILVCE